MRDWLSPIYISNKIFGVVYGLIVSALIIDTSMIRISQFTTELQSSDPYMVAFFFMVSVFIIGQYIFIAFLRSKLKDIQSGILGDLVRISKIVALYQYVLATILVIIALQILTTGVYDRLLLQTPIWLAYLEAISFSLILAFKFVQWIRIQRSNIVMLYLSGSIALIITVSVSLFRVNESLQIFPSYIGPHPSFLPYIISQETLSLIFQVASIALYVSFWLATIVLLRSHSAKFGKIKYWVIATLPLLYFILQYQPLFLQIFDPYRISEPVAFSLFYTLFFSSSSIVGGIFFGIAFWSIARQANNDHIRNLLLLSAYGIALFFITNQAILLASAPYPPFALATNSLVGLAVFLFLVGIYSSSISVASNASFRRSLRGSIVQQLKLLENIGEGQYRHELENRVLSMAKRSLNPVTAEVGLNPSMSEEDVKDYIGQVIDELKKREK
jgi:hypothetical protein